MRAGLLTRVDKASQRTPTERGGIPRYVLLILLSLFTAFPFYVMIVLAFRAPGPVTFPQALLPVNLSLDSISSALNHNDVPIWALNTTIYALGSVVSVLFLASLAGYAFAKMKFRGQEVVFWIVLATLLIPYHLALIPQFILVSGV